MKMTDGGLTEGDDDMMASQLHQRHLILESCSSNQIILVAQTNTVFSFFKK